MTALSLAFGSSDLITYLHQLI